MLYGCYRHHEHQAHKLFPASKTELGIVSRFVCLVLHLNFPPDGRIHLYDFVLVRTWQYWRVDQDEPTAVCPWPAAPVDGYSGHPGHGASPHHLCCPTGISPLWMSLEYVQCNLAKVYCLLPVCWYCHKSLM